MPKASRRMQRLGAVMLSVLIACVLISGSLMAGLKVQAMDLPTHIIVAICGDNIVTQGETCDDGFNNAYGIYGSTTATRVCEPGCQSFGPYCGDGILQVRYSEECDDGNATSGDLCSASCLEEVPVPPRTSGSPPRGIIPTLPATPGTIPADILTKVVLRGKAYPDSIVNILLDGKAFAKTRADSNADFSYSTTDVTPGTATFSFYALDSRGNGSLTTSAIFEVVQSAVTTVANIFLPPTISVAPSRVALGSPVLLSGQSVPLARIRTEIHSASTSLSAVTDKGGNWALQLDTSDMEEGDHTAKASFQISDAIKSGFGKSVTFTIGESSQNGSCGKPDMNEDGKVNLVDFSIFLLSWQSTDAPADYNCDKRVNLADFSIMLFQWTG